MSGLTLGTVCHGGLLTYLVMLSLLSLTTAAVSFDLTELRNKVAKIKVNPRGNLWATGHFMGKKSVLDNPLLSSVEGQGTVDALQVALVPEQTWGSPLVPEQTWGSPLVPEQRDLGDLLQGVLRVALQAHVDTLESRSKNQESELLLKILESYIHNSKK